MAAVLPLALRLVVEDAEEDFFLGTRRLPLRGFSLPMTVSTNEVTALVAVSFVAAMFILAASAIASGTDEITPSLFLCIAISLPAPGKRHNDLRRGASCILNNGAGHMGLAWPWRNKRICRLQSLRLWSWSLCSLALDHRPMPSGAREIFASPRELGHRLPNTPWQPHLDHAKGQRVSAETALRAMTPQPCL